ncbi:hypothetical protein [Thermococcus sp.]
MRRRYIVTCLSVFVIGFLLFAPAIQGVPPAYSYQLYSLYGDWLQGKPVGLAVFNVEPIMNGKEFKGDLILTIINYSSDSPRMVLVKHIRGYSQVAIKIQRVPLGVQTVTEIQDRRVVTKERTVFKDRSYFIGVVGVINGRLYSGGEFVNFEPSKPITKNLRVQLKLTERTLSKEDILRMKSNALTLMKWKEKGRRAVRIKDGIIYTESPAYVEYSSAILPAGVIHAAPWTKVGWGLESGVSTGKPTGLWYDSFHQYVIVGSPDPHSWEKDGKKIALAHSDSCIYFDNTYSSQYRKEVVKAKVEYEMDAYMVASSWLGVTEYVLVPKYIYNLVNGPTSAENPPAIPTVHGTITNNPQTLNFIVNKNGEGWMVQSVTLTFGVGYDSVEADVSITLYRAAGNSNAVPPYLKIYNGKGLKYWYKDHRMDTYEVYFHW